MLRNGVAAASARRGLNENETRALLRRTSSSSARNGLSRGPGTLAQMKFHKSKFISPAGFQPWSGVFSCAGKVPYDIPLRPVDSMSLKRGCPSLPPPP